jgi:hypothetical protein
VLGLAESARLAVAMLVPIVAERTKLGRIPAGQRYHRCLCPWFGRKPDYLCLENEWEAKKGCVEQLHCHIAVHPQDTRIDCPQSNKTLYLL